ncbi:MULTISPECIES: FxsA family protein [Kribbella]|uniref:UPF0716 protein FxsA n=1 Tax=Kribbella pratensis TaxID=2512112 RepID=A0ABY2FIX1_9ACTN|nr:MULTISPECIES: FxsA family protein [Kribbella]TDW91988.1 UPF0716 protein FxsA [Kribbella sp. VKM Ac-2566]TDW93066.1 UPF0716 protein FxsA [Kribbella pratensis]
MPWFVALALLVVPIAEIFVIIQVGQVIGGWPTVALLLVESAFGAWLIKREGRRAWRALQSSFETGKMPGRELADAALVLVGGTLLLTPGFITDIFGFFFVLPFTRPLARRAMTAFFSRRVTTQLGTPGLGTFIPGPGTPGPQRPTNDVIQGEVIDPEKK